MHILKVLGLLTVLLTGNPGLAFANPEAISFEETASNSYLFAEEFQEPGESILTGTPNPLSFHQFQALHIPDFEFRSSYYALRAKIYISNSAFIDPAGDVQEIIFPFHTFL